MDALRRLRNSLLDLALLSRQRPVLDAQALQLTFMTEQLVVTGAPSSGPTDTKRNAVNATDLAHFLDTVYGRHYLLFTCSALQQDEAVTRYAAAGDTLSLVDTLHGQLLDFQWARDGMEAHTPPLDVVFRMCYALDAYLALDRQNVALVNCHTGKTRSALVVACYLLFARLESDPIEALAVFYRKRWHRKALTAQSLREKTPPSIRRFLTEFHQLLGPHKSRNFKPMLLKTIVLRKLPVDLQPRVQMWDDEQLVFCTDADASVEQPVLLDWNEEDGCFAIVWENGLELNGGFSLVCSFGGDYENVDDMDAASRVLFRYAESTLFLSPGLVTLTRHDLDLMKQYAHGFDDDQFSIELNLHENSAKRPRDMVRMDYSGRFAMCQGLIEISKHHVVVPDTAMHSELIRMGFGEVPATFALQCSQNTPSLALELLRCNELSASFVHETMGNTAEQGPVDSIEASQNPQMRFDTPSSTRLGPAFEVDRESSTAPAESQALDGGRNVGGVPTALGIMSTATNKQSRAVDDDSEELGRRKEYVASTGLSCGDLTKATTSLGSLDTSIAVSLATSLTSEKDSDLPGTPDEDTIAAFLSKQNTGRSSNDVSEMFPPKSTGNKYTLMLKRGVPFEAVRNCMQRENVDPSTLQAVLPNESSTGVLSSASQANDIRKRKLKDVDEFSTYFRMLRMGCPKEAVRQKITMDGIDPVILDLGSDAIYEEVKNCIAVRSGVRKVRDGMMNPSAAVNEDESASKISLNGHDVCAKYHTMLKLGVPKGAVCQKMKVDGVDVRILDSGESSFYSTLREQTGGQRPTVTVDEMKLMGHPEYAKYCKMMLAGLSEAAVRKKMQVDGVNEGVMDFCVEAVVSQLPKSYGGNRAKVRDDAATADFDTTKKMVLNEGGVCQRTRLDGVEESAFGRKDNATPVSDISGVGSGVKREGDLINATCSTGMSEGAVRQEMVTDDVELRQLELGTNVSVAQVTSSEPVVAASAAADSPARARKKLHWQAISEDRLQNRDRQKTIWEGEDEDVQFDVDMDELEALFFANHDTASAKKGLLRGPSNALKRKKSVTLFDGKRAMNAAISLARVKLTYSEIAEAVLKFDSSVLSIEQLIGINESLPTSDEVALVSRYTGEKKMLGEAEKFALEIAKVARYGPRMECLIFKMSFPSRSAELTTSLSRLHKASEEVKGSRLLKSLLAIVLKLGNTLNGSKEDNGIKGFTVDSLLRLGHTKAVNQKTTVLHYLVRLMKKNHVQVLDFQAELPSVALAARESFATIDAEFAKLGKGLSSLRTEQGMLEKQSVKTMGLEATIAVIQADVADIDAQMETIGDGISRARKEVSSVLDYFGEDPKRNPSEVFATLASFCTVFQQARNEVDAADEAARRKERLTIRRSNTLRPLPKSSDNATIKVVSSGST
ncbi:unnamed protein product [Hyaloperonospora brassicae]|uniref:Formin-like protein n=1 Tax=Hyaloperonospora brassicae TaxID=162125 RepID=A0AAV0TB03_HYABA|nr:unnamed protein product [Hyaloperonospora brassicae]